MQNHTIAAKAESENNKQAIIRPMRFAVIMPWPGIKNAEYEIIERFKIVAERQGHSCDTIDKEGNILFNSSFKIGKANAEEYDFVISPHYESYRYLDTFHYYTLWNPNIFIQESEFFEKCLAQIMSCEAVLTTGAQNVENFMESLPRKYEEKMAAYPVFYPSSPTLDLESRITKKSVYFYTGINWEAITSKKGRYHDLLQALDRKKLIRIHGPRKFEGVRPWRGYKTYAGEIPFDGKTLIKELNTCGVTLVIASEHHNKDNLLSNRVWEGLAAHTIIVSNRHDKMIELLGDSALYFDLDDNPTGQLFEHIRWIRENPDKATEMANRSYRIFLDHLSLDRQLSNLVSGHRKSVESYEQKALATKTEEPVAILIHTPDVKILEKLKALSKSLKKQSYHNYKLYLAIDRKLVSFAERHLAGENVELLPYDFFPDDGAGGDNENIKRKSGEILVDIIGQVEEDYCLLVRPGMALMKNHVSQLKRMLEDNDKAQAAFPAIIRRIDGALTVEGLDFVDIGGLSGSPFFTSALYRTSYLHSFPKSLLCGLDWFEDTLFLKDLHFKSVANGQPMLQVSAVPSMSLESFDANWYRPLFHSARMTNAPRQEKIISQFLSKSYPYQTFTNREVERDALEVLRIRTANAVRGKSKILYWILQKSFRFLFR